MLDANCPNCGAPLQFRSANLVAKVCDYCRSTIVRRGEVLENVGKAAEVPDDVSPVQLGVRGRVMESGGQLGFEIVGRVRWAYADGAWNEWCALCSDGGYAWLSEASGRWMWLREAPTSVFGGEAVARLASGQPVGIGMTAVIAELEYSAVDVQQVECIGAEGELPYPTPIGTKATSVDLQRGDRRAASLQNDGGQASAYAGRYVTLAEVGATGLRQFEGLAGAEVCGVVCSDFTSSSPAKAGAQLRRFPMRGDILHFQKHRNWTPAFAGEDAIAAAGA